MNECEYCKHLTRKIREYDSRIEETQIKLSRALNEIDRLREEIRKLSADLPTGKGIGV